MSGGQNHVVFWTLRPNLSSRLGKAATSNLSLETTTPTEQPSPETERAPASNEAVAVPPSANASIFSSAEKAMAETFTCGIAIGGAARPVFGGSRPAAAGEVEVVAVAVTGTAGGAFAVWENFECVKMVQGAHGEPVVVAVKDYSRTEAGAVSLNHESFFYAGCSIGFVPIDFGRGWSKS